jgi:hypothetical protein
LLGNNSALDAAGVRENDLLFVQRQQPNYLANPLSNPQAFADYIRSKPDVMQQISQSNPALAEAILLNDHSRLVSILTTIENSKKQQEAEKIRRIVSLWVF